MALWSTRERQPVATVEVAFFGERSATVTNWVDEAERDVKSYHAILHLMMYYARLLFFLSFRDTAEELVGWMDDAVRALAAAEPEARVPVARDWTLLSERPNEEPRATWSSSLMLLAPGKYKCVEQRPEDPEDADAQATALLYLQRLVDTLPALERAYLALGIAGMHEYYREVGHWNSTKALHPAPAYGISHARKVLQGSGRGANV